MGKEHLTYFKVENFKRFDSLELTDIGQFNLIVGDNNVGKTSVLEALLFDIDREKCLGNLHKTLILKGINLIPQRVFGPRGEVANVEYPPENFLTFLAKDISKPIRIFGKKVNTDEEVRIGMKQLDPEEWHSHRPAPEEGFLTFLGQSPDDRYLSFFYNRENIEGEKNRSRREYWGGLYAHCLSQDLKDIALPLVLISLDENDTILHTYIEQVSFSRNAKKQLTADMRDDLKFLLPDIEELEVRKINGEDQLLVGLKDKDELMPISTFGESVIRATQILLEISKHKGKRLMIDEIDTGIHYSRMKNFLKTIFQVAEKNDVQLFMTTHSLECQQAFAEVFEDPDMVQYQAKARNYTLVEKPDGQVAAQAFNFDAMKFSLDTGFEIRGGAL